MSSVGNCPRALSAERLDYPCEAAPDWLERAAEEGKKHEQWIKEELRADDIAVYGEQTEVALEFPNFKLVGHIDGIVNDHGVDGLLEIKSMSQYEFDRWMRGRFEEFPSYAAQITCYQKALTEQMAKYQMGIGERADGPMQIRYYVKNRSSGYIDKATLTEPPANFDEIIAKLNRVEDCVRNGVLAEEEYKPDSIQCRRCFYKSLCVPEPKILSAVDEKTLLEACEKWREGSLMVSEGEQLVKDAKEIFKTHTEVSGQKKWKFNELAIIKIDVKESVTYPKANLLKVFTEEQLKPASEIKLPYSYVRIDDLRGGER
jgi:hypothetical protein